MIVKARSGWGYETLVREVSDSLHLRRFCRIGLWDRVPDESTVRKLVRRLGADVIEDICSQVIAEATSPRAGARRFVVRAARIDSTVVEADIRYPTDLGLAQDAARALAREAAKARGLAGAGAPRVKDRSRQVASRLRRVNRSVAARTGHSKPLALRLTGEAGELLAASIREARRLAARLRERARGRGAAVKQAAADRLDRLCRAGREGLRADRVAARGQADQRPAGLHQRPRRAPDPQGQTQQADRVRLRHATHRTVREHPPRRPRPDPARQHRHRLAQRGPAAARHRPTAP